MDDRSREVCDRLSVPLDDGDHLVGAGRKVRNLERALRDALLRHVWGEEYLGGTRTVDVHIRRLRAKIGPQFDELIQTVRNVGYKMIEESKS